MKDVFKVEEAARICNTSIWTMHRRIKEGAIQSFRAGGGRTVLITRAELIKFLEANHMPIPVDLIQDGKRILMIDHPHPDLHKLKDFLADQKYHLEWVYSSFAAGLIIREFNPQLILLNINYPKVDPNDLAQVLRSDAKLNDIRILGYAYPAGEQDPNRLAEARCDDILSIPFQPETVVHKIQTLLDQALPNTNESRPAG